MNIKKKLGASKYTEILNNSIITHGNNYRLKIALKEKTIKLAFLGGSVTQGYTPEKMIESCYPSLVKDKFLQQINNEVNCDFINLGFSGTDSSMGLILTETYLIEYQPNVVFIEYAINHDISIESATRFESLIRKLLQLESNPTVIIITLLTNEFYSAQDLMLHIAKHYELPVISILDTLAPLLKENRLSWSDYSMDEGHANTFGHELIADCLISYLTHVSKSKSDMIYSINNQVLYSSTYENLKLINMNDTSACETTFHHESLRLCLLPFVLQNNKTGKFHFFKTKQKCHGLFIVFLQCNHKEFGAANIFINNKKVCTLPGYSIFGWYNPIIKILPISNTLESHNIEIIMEKEDEKKEFYLLSIGLY
jgi:acyl-CoA thioesterase I